MTKFGIALAVLAAVSASSGGAGAQTPETAIAITLTDFAFTPSMLSGIFNLVPAISMLAVLIVFVILLTRGGDSDSPPLFQVALPLTGLLVAACLFAVLAWAVFHSFAVHPGGTPPTPATVRELGAVLMDSYVLPLEVIGLMLTAALIGAVIIAMKENAQ